MRLMLYAVVFRMYQQTHSLIVAVQMVDHNNCQNPVMDIQHENVILNVVIADYVMKMNDPIVQYDSFVTDHLLPIQYP